MNRVLRLRLRSQVIVTLKSGSAFRGVLMESDRQALVVRNAEHLGGPEGATPVDGEIVLMVADVLFIQVL